MHRRNTWKRPEQSTATADPAQQRASSTSAGTGLPQPGPAQRMGVGAQHQPVQHQQSGRKLTWVRPPDTAPSGQPAQAPGTLPSSGQRALQPQPQPSSAAAPARTSANTAPGGSLPGKHATQSHKWVRQPPAGEQPAPPTATSSTAAPQPTGTLARAGTQVAGPSNPTAPTRPKSVATSHKSTLSVPTQRRVWVRGAEGQGAQGPTTAPTASQSSKTTRAHPARASLSRFALKPAPKRLKRGSNVYRRVEGTVLKTQLGKRVSVGDPCQLVSPAVKRLRTGTGQPTQTTEGAASLRYKSLGRGRLVLAGSTPTPAHTAHTRLTRQTAQRARGSKVFQWVREGALPLPTHRLTTSAADSCPHTLTRQPQRTAQAGRAGVNKTAPAQSAQLVRLGDKHYLVVRGPHGKRQLRAATGAEPGSQSHTRLSTPARTPAILRTSKASTGSVTKRVGPLLNNKWTSSIAAKRISTSLQMARTRTQRAAAPRKRLTVPCSVYCRTGVCPGQSDGTCQLEHDPLKVSVCTHWLQGTCNRPDCKLQHRKCKDLMPVCTYFLKGLCTTEDCPYLHVRYPPNTVQCRAFRFGFCPLGERCSKRHERPVAKRTKVVRGKERKR